MSEKTGGMDIERAAFDFIDRTRDLSDPQAILASLQQESEKFGFPHFVITGLPLPMEQLAPLVMLNAWPQEWYARYTEKNYFADDGVAQWSLRTTRPYRWGDVPAELAERRQARIIMGEADSVGFRDGYVVPMYSARNWQTAVAFAAEHPLDMSERELSALQIMGIFAANGVRQLIETCPRAKVLLSPRERECLLWIAAGKSSWDISVILGLAQSTIHGYLKGIRRKLDVTTMAQAVAEAIRKGEIHP